MLENLYTTKMSGNAKTLQKRFAKIRSRQSGRSRIMAAVMAVTLAASALGATIAMAAAGADGLEHWDRNEIYFRDGMDFAVNVSGKNVPEWVNEDIAGEDGNVDIVITRYQTRNLRGLVHNDHLIKLSGAKGSVSLAAQAWSMAAPTTNTDIYCEEINPAVRQYKYYSDMDFIEFNNPGYAGVWNEPIMALVNKGEKKNRRIEVRFALDENYDLKTAYVRFLLSDDNDNPIDERFDVLETNREFSYIGNFKESYIKDVTDEDNDNNYYFTMYEDNYVNKPAEGINIAVERATTDGIVVTSDITLPEAAKICISVYNQKGREVADNGRQIDISPVYDISPIYILTPAKMTNYFTVDRGDEEEVQTTVKEIPENQFVKGEEYRVCVVVFDEDYTVLYRWQQYVTLE